MDDIQINIVKSTGKPSISKQKPQEPKLSIRQQRKEKIQKKQMKIEKYGIKKDRSMIQNTEQYNNEQTDQQPGEQLEDQQQQQNRPQRVKYIHKPKKVNLPEADNQQNQEQEKTFFTAGTFAELDYIHNNIRSALQETEFTKLTKIQQSAIPVVYKSQNTFIKSETGSGKTLAYLVPLFSKLMQSEIRVTREAGTKILIICPTRELSLQCVDVALKCGKRCPNIVIGALVGGENPKHEKARLRKGVTILIGTPGRMIYHMENTQSFKYDQINTLVFEECDRILDMGFKKDVEQILSVLSSKIQLQDCQKIMVSAHINQNICQIKGLQINPKNYQMVGFTEEFMKHANNTVIEEEVDDQENVQCNWLGDGDETWEIPTTLQQFYTTVAEQQKLAFLFSFVLSQQGKKSILFVSTCDEVEFFSFILSHVELFNPLKEEFEWKRKQNQDESEKPQKQILVQQEIYKLHGNIEQKQRSKTYFEFKKSKNENGCLLISTSVASRGLDFPDVANILLFDPPDSYDDYINKVGRTARINHNGLSLLVLFENLESHNFIHEVQNHLQSRLSFVDAQQYFKAFQYYLFQKMNLNDKMPDKFLGLMIRQTINRDRDLYSMSRRAYVSFVRAYGRLKKFKIKTLNLHKLSKSFGLDEAAAKETQDEQYQHELIRINREKFRNKGITLREDKWDQMRKKRKVVSERVLSKMEFM